MKTLLLLLTLLLAPLIAQGQLVDKFAIIGDFGTNDSNQRKVTQLVNNWSPSFIVTTGDNYHRVGLTYDSAIGVHYPRYYKKNISLNKFFTVPGNHDIWDQDPLLQNYLGYYKDYMTLPNNERYYSIEDTTKLFVMTNSDFGGSFSYCPNRRQVYEPSGIDSSSIQGQWAKGLLKNSNKKWKLVVTHYPPYFDFPYNVDTTSTVNCDGTPYRIKILVDTLFKQLRWPFKQWTADIVLSGHTHVYNRLKVGGMDYLIQSLGGGKRGPYFANRREGSQIMYNAKHGATLVEEYRDSMVFRMITVDKDTIENFVLYPQKSIRIKSLVEGLYNPISKITTKDTMKAYLRGTELPYAKYDSCARLVNSQGDAIFYFPRGRVGSNYYLELRHRNSLGVWSAAPVTLQDSLINYDFTNSSLVYGSNVKEQDGVHVLYSGDVNQDNSIDGTDALLIDNDVVNFADGYRSTDLDGDLQTEINDLSICDYNTYKFLCGQRP